MADQSVFVRGAVSGVVRETLIAACLTAFMILTFLGSWRSTLIIATSIPLAILTSIILFSALGETINIMTLGGLALAVTLNEHAACPLNRSFSSFPFWNSTNPGGRISFNSLKTHGLEFSARHRPAYLRFCDDETSVSSLQPLTSSFQNRYNLPMPIRLIALDIDGTILDGRGKVSSDNSATVALAAAAGIEIVLVTGRRFDFARPISDGLPCDLHLIVNNGALIKSKDGATLLRHLLPTATARRVLDATEDYRAATAVVFDRPREAQVVMEHINFSDPLRGPYFRRNAEYLAEVQPLTDALDGTDPIQVMFSSGCEEMRAARKRLQDEAFAAEFTTELTEYEARNFSILDVLQRGVSKGVALAEWTRRRGVAREDVMAVGDNWNDREMLEFAGVPVVMGNSVKGLKSLGWPVTLSNDESGVAEAIRTYAFGEKLKTRP